jgi:hypothetical protein
MQGLLARYLETYAGRIALKSKPYAGVEDALQWLMERGIGSAI